MKPWLWAGFWVFLSLPLAGAAPLTEIQSMLARPEVLCGRFEQSKQLIGLKKLVKSSGRFCVAAAKGVLWRTLKPFPTTVRLTRDEIVQLQGERVSLRLDAKREPALRLINSVLVGLLAGDLSRLETLFEIDGALQPNGWRVVLKPREAGLANVFGSISLDGGAYIRSLAIEEAAGDRTSIVFSGIETGPGAMDGDEARLF